MLILDIFMFEIDGYVFCFLFRFKSCVLIIIVFVKDMEFDKIIGFKFGCDDYFIKLFSLLEFIVRVNSIFRWIKLDKLFIKDSKIVKIFDILINLNIK